MVDLIFVGTVVMAIILLVAIAFIAIDKRKSGQQADSSGSLWCRFQKWCKEHLDDFLQLSQLFH